jgi:hypothetical protein
MYAFIMDSSSPNPISKVDQCTCDSALCVDASLPYLIAIPPEVLNPAENPSIALLILL